MYRLDRADLVVCKHNAHKHGVWTDCFFKEDIKSLNVGMPKQATYVGEIPILKITAKQSRWSTEMMSFLELGTLTFAV